MYDLGDIINLLLQVKAQLTEYTDIKDRIEGVILSWMCQEVDEAMYMCAGMVCIVVPVISYLTFLRRNQQIHGISVGGSYLHRVSILICNQSALINLSEACLSDMREVKTTVSFLMHITECHDTEP